MSAQDKTVPTFMLRTFPNRKAHLSLPDAKRSLCGLARDYDFCSTITLKQFSIVKNRKGKCLECPELAKQLIGK